LDLLEIKGSIITIDAMGTQKAIAEKMTGKEAHHILAVKDNRKTLREEARTACKCYNSLVDLSETDKGHGRIETRRCQVFAKGLMVIAHNRKGLQSVIKITSSGEIRGKVTTEERYYISSPDPRQPFNAFIRNHWEVENKLHRTSDMVFREDEQRKRTKHAAGNFALVRKVALNILKKDAGKESLRFHIQQKNRHLTKKEAFCHISFMRRLRLYS
jgi:predicted transposase YbfD/YdcC